MTTPHYPDVLEIDFVAAASQSVGIDESQILCLYQWGSRLFGNNEGTHSDFDLMAVVSDYAGPIRRKGVKKHRLKEVEDFNNVFDPSAFEASNDENHLLSPEDAHFANVVQSKLPDGRGLDVAVYEKNYWQYLNNEHFIWCLPFQFLKEIEQVHSKELGHKVRYVYKEEERFQLNNLRLLKLKYEILCDASKNFKYANKFWMKNQQYKRAKKRVVYILQHMEFAVQLAQSGKIFDIHAGNKYHKEVMSLQIDSWEQLETWAFNYFNTLQLTIRDLCNVYRSVSMDEWGWPAPAIAKFGNNDTRIKFTTKAKISTSSNNNAIKDNNNNSNIPSTKSALSILDFLNHIPLNQLMYVLSVTPRKLSPLICKSNQHITSSADIYQLVHHPIESPLEAPFVQDCCGVVVQVDEGNKVKVLAMPFRKIFDISETEFGDPVDTIVWSTEIKVFQKLDGILLTLFYVESWNDWAVVPRSTSANFDKSLTPSDLNLVQQFWTLWEKRGYQLPSSTNVCFVFEFVSAKHRKVILYEEDDIFLIGARDLLTLHEVDSEQIAKDLGWKHCPRIAASFSKKKPRHDLQDLCWKSLMELKPTQYCGYVLVDSHYNRIQFKSPVCTILENMIQEWKKIIALTQDNCNNNNSEIDLFTASNNTALEYSAIPLEEQYRCFLLIVRCLKTKEEEHDFLEQFPQFAQVFHHVHHQFTSFCDQLDAAYKDLSSRVKTEKEFADEAAKKHHSGVLFLLHKEHQTAAEVLKTIQSLQNPKMTTGLEKWLFRIDEHKKQFSTTKLKKASHKLNVKYTTA